jgi:hypothetical protein
MAKRQRVKACEFLSKTRGERCSKVADVLYRVQYDDSGRWFFICDGCFPEVSDRPGYVYGGTWKSKKR